jgi:hypothetical protein
MNVSYWNNALDHAMNAGIKSSTTPDPFMQNFWSKVELKYYEIADRGI